MTISCTESSTSVPNHMCMAQHRETTGNGWFPTKHAQILGERLVPHFRASAHQMVPASCAIEVDFDTWRGCNGEENSAMTGLRGVI